MRGEKLSYTEYLTSQKMGDGSKTANITDLRKRNKEEEKKDKLIKKLRDMASKGMEVEGVKDDERFNDMPPPEIIVTLLEDVKKYREVLIQP